MTLALLVAAACSPEQPRAELLYRLSNEDGGKVTDGMTRRMITEFDLRLLEAGYDRRYVAAMEDGRLRVVLPENVAHRMDDVRRVLEQGKPLPVRIELVTPTKRKE